MNAKAELMQAYRELSDVLRGLQAVITAETPAVDPFVVRDASGAFVLAPIITAKAQVLVAICSLDHLDPK